TPIGVTVKPAGKLVVDFEVVVANPVSPPGTTGLVIDPGIVYNWGAFATGLRLAFQTNANTNVGLIPLINVGVADLGGATWFVEVASEDAGIAAMLVAAPLEAANLVRRIRLELGNRAAGPGRRRDGRGHGDGRRRGLGRVGDDRRKLGRGLVAWLLRLGPP